MKKHYGLIINCVIITLVLGAVLPFSSCTSRRSKEKFNDLIPEKDLIVVLTDVYFTDGLLTVPEVEEQHWLRDSVTIYMEVIDRHGYTKTQLDNTLKYYFLYKPRKLQKIYNSVIANLSRIEAEVDMMDNSPKNSENMWPGEASYTLPEGGMVDKVYFDLTIPDTGTYVFTASVRVYPDDESENPRITIWFWKSDTSQLGISSYWNDVPLPKDGVVQSRTVSATIADTSYTRIRGTLMNHDPKPGTWEKHSHISSISLTRIER